jgi:uncharacterized damage-inducible protein DinB
MKEKDYKEITIKIPAKFPEIIPKEAKVHMLNAYKEFLLAIKELTEEGIKRIEEEISESEEKKLKKIEVK